MGSEKQGEEQEIRCSSAIDRAGSANGTLPRGCPGNARLRAGLWRAALAAAAAADEAWRANGSFAAAVTPARFGWCVRGWTEADFCNHFHFAAVFGIYKIFTLFDSKFYTTATKYL